MKRISVMCKGRIRAWEEEKNEGLGESSKGLGESGEAKA